MPFYHRHCRDWELAEKLYTHRCLASPHAKAAIAELNLPENSPLAPIAMQLAFRSAVLDELERCEADRVKAATGAVLQSANENEAST